MTFRFFFFYKKNKHSVPGRDETRGRVDKMGLDFFGKYDIIIL